MTSCTGTRMASSAGRRTGSSATRWRSPTPSRPTSCGAGGSIRRGIVHVRRQVKLIGPHQVFGPPKYGRVRDVPLSESVKGYLAAYLAKWPVREISLPWRSHHAKRVTATLMATTRERTVINRSYFNSHVWKPALREAGVLVSRENGTHALRHFFASALLDGGESIRAVSEYLGHADPGFTLRVYTHLMPGECRADAQDHRRRVRPSGRCHIHVTGGGLRPDDAGRRCGHLPWSGRSHEQAFGVRNRQIRCRNTARTPTGAGGAASRRPRGSACTPPRSPAGRR